MAAPPCDAPLTAASNIQPFFVLHKAAAASSAPASRGRRRADSSQPSLPGPKSSKRSRDVDASDEDVSELYQRLRLEAFHRTWSKIQSTIDEVLRGINLKLFDQVLHWIQESFSAIRAIAKPHHSEIQQPYPLITDVICRRIPAAFVLTKNAEFVDDITTFRDLAEHLESNGCHLAKLSATELSPKNGVGGCFRNLLRQLLSDVPDVADVSSLASWYCDTENYDQPIIIIIDDLEQCSGDILGELMMMLSEWVIKIPIFFVMGIATTLDAPRKLLSSEALQRLEPCKLTLGSPTDRMNALVEAILVKPCAGFCISHEVAVFLRNYFFRHDGTITSFISALKELWREKIEALPEAMQKYAFSLPSCTSGKNSSDPSISISEGLLELLKLQRDWSAVLLCLYEAGRHDKVQLLDIFCEAINPDLQNASNRDLFSKTTSENLSGAKLGSGNRFIDQAMNTVRYLPLETLSRVLDVWSAHLKGMSEISDKLKELQSTTIGADNVRTAKEKWTRKYLVPVECLPFHEIICFKNVGILQSALIGNPRRMVQLDLLKSQSHLKCSCCSRSGTAVSGSLHDTSIMCNLAQEYGDVINLHDWYIAFEEQDSAEPLLRCKSPVFFGCQAREGLILCRESHLALRDLNRRDPVADGIKALDSIL
ncbi:hypothetical protein PR202_gb07937 [Eleusine coracana subsp. coracana]|uniref:Origin of replication complex subunit 3 n=1 Tax=Eleusine coracana subsp. coracana TaxID=191504 RepID=A0AAV5EE71_ELECO|nr:hypothetical protein PR202_gb07937 [Eleusine coracana subsp. coracana]